MADANHLLTRVFMRWNNRWATIWSMRSVADAGIPRAEPEIARSNREFVQRFLLRPDANLILGDRDEFIRAGYPEQIAEQMTRSTIMSARASVDAASVVFAHSVLDDMVIDCLRIAAFVAPADLEQFFGRRTLPLAEFRGTTYDVLRNRLLERYLGDLSKESLLEKIDRLHACCQPPPGWEPTRGYHYDRGRLARLDRLRHDIVHGEGPQNTIPNLDDELDYMLRTGMYLISLVNYRYDTRIDPNALRAEIQRPGP